MEYVNLGVAHVLIRLACPIVVVAETIGWLLGKADMTANEMFDPISEVYMKPRN